MPPSGDPSFSPEDLSRLKAVFDGAMAGLDGVEAKRLFGCDGYFIRGNIFALVWKDGRLGLRLTDGSSHEALMALDGADPWRMGGELMRHWVLLPVGMHSKPSQLRVWVGKAWKQAGERPAKEAVTRRKAAKTIQAAVFKRLPGTTKMK
jgi:TfoX/Sxy family transcriptional regulator of competence genes